MGTQIIDIYFVSHYVGFETVLSCRDNLADVGM